MLDHCGYSYVLHALEEQTLCGQYASVTYHPVTPHAPCSALQTQCQ